MLKNVLTALLASLLLVAGLSVSQAADASGNKLRPVYAQAPVFNPLNTIACGIWILPARCTAAERIVGTTIVGAGLGFGVGAALGAGGYTITGGSFLAAKGTAAMAWSTAAIGTGAGFLGGTGVGYAGY